MVSSIVLCMVTRNKAINTTTLHSAMIFNMVCMSRNISLEIQFHTDRSNFQKAMKNAERMVWIDYGVALDRENIERIVLSDFPENYKVLVVPCVTESVDWNAFKKKTLAGSSEPTHQRALKFDTECSSSTSKNGISEFTSSTTDGRVIIMDTKAVLKKLRDHDASYKSLDQIKKMGVKIGVLKSCPVTCHYVYECFGNIIESSGVRVGP